MTAYVLDADAFIESKKRWYGFDICPAYWDWLDGRFTVGDVCSVRKVFDEIAAGGDDLTVWTSSRQAYFCEPNAADIVAMTRVSTWATGHERYNAAATATFLAAGDSYVVAHALATGATVVTLEVPRNKITQIKVPDACRELDVRVINPFEMLRETGASFRLEAL